MSDSPEAVQPAEAARVLLGLGARPPEIALVLGTGLDGLAGEVKGEASVPFHEVPGFPETTVAFHEGRFLLGTLGDRPVAVMKGRFHHYEGFGLRELAFPVRVLRAMGCNTIVLTGAGGGCNPLYRRGDIVGVDDHINMLWLNPLMGPNDDALGPRFPDMSRPYDPALLEAAERVPLAGGRPMQRGVYAWVPGPCLETRAEYRFLRAVGADVVGMSLVPEVIAAVHCGMRVAAFVVVTDMGLPDALEPIDVPAILATAAEAGPRLSALVRAVVEEA